MSNLQGLPKIFKHHKSVALVRDYLVRDVVYLIKDYMILHPIDLSLILKLIGNGKRHNNSFIVRTNARLQL